MSRGGAANDTAIARRSILYLALGAAVATVGQAGFGLLRLEPLASAEARWLASSSGLAPRAVEAWIETAGGSEAWLRGPVVALEIFLVLLTALVAGRAAGAAASLLAAVAVCAQVGMLSDGHLVGSNAPFALLAASLVLLLALRRGAPSIGVLLGLATALAFVEPGLAAVPAGAGAALGLARFGGTSVAARAASGLSALLLLALLLARPPLSWHGRTGGTAANVLQMLVLATLAAIAATAAWRERRGEAAGPSAEAPWAVGPWAVAAPGAIAGALAWLLIPALRELSSAPLPMLLALAPGLAAVLLPATEAGGVRMAAVAGAAPGSIPAERAADGEAVRPVSQRAFGTAPSAAEGASRASDPGRSAPAGQGAGLTPGPRYDSTGRSESGTGAPSAPPGAPQQPLPPGVGKTSTGRSENGTETPSAPSGEAPGRVPPRPRFAARHSVLALLAAVSVAAWFATSPQGADRLPLEETVAAMRESAPGVREILIGPGLPKTFLSAAARRHGLRLADRPGEAEVGFIGLAEGIATVRARDEQAHLLAGRVLDGHGAVETGGLALRWSTYRPLRLEAGAGGPRPNIAIVSVDTLRADHLGLYGYARATSPNLDRWAAGARVYERAMATAPSTAPSFASLMTGRLPLAHGVRRNYEFLDAGNWTLPRILKEVGYETAAFVSSFVLTAENSGLDLGFDHYDQALDQEELRRKNRPIRLAPSLAEAVLAWLGDRKEDGPPWFLWVHAIDPHGPYTPLPAFAGAFRGGATRTLRREMIPDYQWLETLDYAAYVDAYDAEILQTDHHLGPVLDRIAQAPSPRGTIVVFTSDHGEALGEHGAYFQHSQSLHAEEIHVPLIVKDSARPGQTVRIAAPVSTLDILPTLLDRLGIETDLPLDGLALDRREREGGVVLGNWLPGEVMACRTPLKLMTREGRLDHPLSRLYNMISDPAETEPIASAAEAPGDLIAAALRLLERDPLTALVERALDRQHWEGLDPEARESLRSLGYTGP